jgi:hypothetical protein
LHRDCPALGIFRETPGLGHALWFGDREEIPVDDAANIIGTFLEEVIARQRFDRRASLERFSASTMARRHAEVFEACVQ